MFTLGCSVDCISEYLPWSVCNQTSGRRTREVRIDCQGRIGKAMLRRIYDGGMWSEWSAWGEGGSRCSSSSATESRVRSVINSIVAEEAGKCEPGEFQGCDFGQHICYGACPAAVARSSDASAVAMIRPISRWYLGHPAQDRWFFGCRQPLRSSCNNNNNNNNSKVVIDGATMWFNNTDNGLPAIS